MKSLLLASSLVALAAFSASASAQQYPTRNITMLVPYAAGGPTDTVARVVAQAMGKPLGQTVIVENRPSAGGILAPEQVKNAKPDGYTILIHHIGMATTPALYRQLRFNPLADFEYIGLINDVPMTLIARGNFPAKDFKEFLDYVKKNKDKVTLRECRHRRGVAPVRDAVHERDPDRRAHRALQGHGAGDERSARRAGGLHVRPDHQHHLADQERQGQGLRRDVAQAASNPCPDVPTLDEPGAQGLRGRHLARRSTARRACRSRCRTSWSAALQEAVKDGGGAEALRRAGRHDLSAREGDAAGAAAAPQGRDRQVDAAHQEGRACTPTEAASTSGRCRTAPACSSSRPASRSACR